jgi:uncharacterized protein YcgL (UPF0745 family)
MHSKLFNFYKRWFDPIGREANLLELKERKQLVEEISKARKEWSEAQARLDWALGQDHIDYSIYALEAAEKRYEMLLRIAKQKDWDDAPSALMEKESG